MKQKTLSFRFMLVSMMLAVVLVLAACGDDEPDVDTAAPVESVEEGAEEAVQEGEEVVEETEAEVEEAVEGEEAEEGEAEVVEGDEETEVITETEVMTDTDVVAETEIITESEVTTLVTTTVVTTDTVVEEETDVVQESETMTETLDSESESSTSTDVVTDTEEATEGEDAEAAVDTEAEAVVSRGFADAQNTYVRGFTLLDYDFVNQDGEVSGEIEDLMINAQTGDILFAAIEYGGFLDIGDTELVVPMSAFRWAEDGSLVLNFDEQTLENFPDVGDDWPDLSTPGWDDDVNQFWRDSGIDTVVDFEEGEDTSTIVWLSELAGYGIADMGFGAGLVEDLLINLESGRAEYALVGWGAGAGVDAPYVLPLSALDIANRGDELVMTGELSEEVLIGAPRLDPALYPAGELVGPEFDDEADAYWTEQGFELDD